MLVKMQINPAKMELIIARITELDYKEIEAIKRNL